MPTSGTIVGMSAGRSDTPTIKPDIAAGDLAATEGRWRDAIDRWERALLAQPGLEVAVAHRLSWFTEQGSTPERRFRGESLRRIAGSMVTAVMAAVLVLLPGDPGSTFSNLMAAGAWVLIAMSIATAIMASRRIGKDRTTTAGDISKRFNDARTRADRLGLTHKREQTNS